MTTCFPSRLRIRLLNPRRVSGFQPDFSTRFYCGSLPCPFGFRRAEGRPVPKRDRECWAEFAILKEASELIVGSILTVMCRTKAIGAGALEFEHQAWPSLCYSNPPWPSSGLWTLGLQEKY